MVVGYIAFDAGDRKRAHYPLFFLLFSTILMIMTARWKRIAEYWPPFAVMFAAFSLQPWLAGARSAFTNLPTDVLDELQPFLDRDELTTSSDETENRALRRNDYRRRDRHSIGSCSRSKCTCHDGGLGRSERHDHYRAGAEWMRANIPPGEIIFNTDWDDFPGSLL